MFEALRNLFAYKKQTQKPVRFRNFTAAQNNDLTRGWISEQRDLNQILSNDLDKLRERARTLHRNSDYVVRYRSLLEANIVGPRGFVLQSKAEDQKLAQQIETEFQNWCDNFCDYTNQQNFIEMCKSIIGSMPYDGEFLVMPVSDDRNPYGISLQRIDVSLIDTNKNISLNDSSRTIINGIELTQDWQRIAIHLKDTKYSSGKTSQPQTISYNNVIHGFKITEANQTRGVPWITSGMVALHQLQGYMTSAVLAAQNGANNAGFIINNNPVSPLDEEEDPSISQPLRYDVLPAGADFKQLNSQYPSNSFAPFVKTLLKRIAMGWGISYSSLTGDLESVNYSSMRTGLLQERDNWINIQNWFLYAFINRVFDKWLTSAHNRNIFNVRDFSKLTPREWQARRWEWIDPKNDAAAKIQLAKAGIVPVDSLSNSMGYNFTDNLDKMAKLKDYANKLKLNINLFEEIKNVWK